jgi:hypothetical protein
MKATTIIKALQRLNNQEEDCEVIVHTNGQWFNPIVRRGIDSNGRKYILINLVRR